VIDEPRLGGLYYLFLALVAAYVVVYLGVVKQKYNSLEVPAGG
jgi:hypothetical protein